MTLTIACDYQELVVFGDVVLVYVREAGDDLLFWRQLGALLELEVANSAREGKVAVDTTKVDEATGGANSSLLALEKLV